MTLVATKSGYLDWCDTVRRPAHASQSYPLVTLSHPDSSTQTKWYDLNSAISCKYSSCRSGSCSFTFCWTKFLDEPIEESAQLICTVLHEHGRMIVECKEGRPTPLPHLAMVQNFVEIALQASKTVEAHARFVSHINSDWRVRIALHDAGYGETPHLAAKYSLVVCLGKAVQTRRVQSCSATPHLSGSAQQCS